MSAPVQRSPHPVVERTTRLPFSAEAVHGWLSRPGARDRLLPPWERVETPAGGAGPEPAAGTAGAARTVRRVRLGPARFHWVTEQRATAVGDARELVDEQVEGPFAHWVHTVRVVPEGPASCLVTDRVEYAPPYGSLGVAADLWVVRPRLQRLLAYRHAVLRDDLAAHVRFAGAAGAGATAGAGAGAGPLHVAVTGASGLIGRALAAFLEAGGHRVTRVVRRSPAVGEIRWDPAASGLDPAPFEGVDAVVHLAGENLAGGPWTSARKRRIRESRVHGTELLARTLAALGRPPRVLVCASAVGIYGSRGDEILDDESPPAPRGDFLADVVREWEAAAAPARAAGIRVAQPRFGVVLSPAGGALAKMLPVFRIGLGGPVGGRRQWLSWISIDDAIGAIHHALFTEELAGPFNAVSPTPVTNAEFARTLARVLGRPAVLPVPAALLTALFGEMARATLLASIRALPRRLERSGYRFRHPALEPALRHLLGRPAEP